MAHHLPPEIQKLNSEPALSSSNSSYLREFDSFQFQKSTKELEASFQERKEEISRMVEVSSLNRGCAKALE